MTNATPQTVLQKYSPQRRDELLTFLSKEEQTEVANIIEGYQNESLWNKLGEKKADWDAGPLLWLTQYTKTEDQHWLAKGTEPVAPFPKKQYFLVLMRLMLESEVLFIWKSREMMTSWLACAYIAWMCQWFPQVLWLIQTQKETKVLELVNYCRILHRRQPEWMQAKNKLVTDNTTELIYANGSRVVGVPQGEHQVRLYHPFGYMMDEAAFLPDAQQCFDAVRPVAKQILGVSSDEIGWFRNQCAI